MSEILSSEAVPEVPAGVLSGTLFGLTEKEGKDFDASGLLSGLGEAMTYRLHCWRCWKRWDGEERHIRSPKRCRTFPRTSISRAFATCWRRLVMKAA